MSHSGLIPCVKRLNEGLWCVEAMSHFSRLGVVVLICWGKAQHSLKAPAETVELMNFGCTVCMYTHTLRLLICPLDYRDELRRRPCNDLMPRIPSPSKTPAVYQTDCFQVDDFKAVFLSSLVVLLLYCRGIQSMPRCNSFISWTAAQ